MFKLVVLFGLAAVVAARPSGWETPVVSYSLPAVAVPAAVSSTYRRDVINKPVIAYSAHPVVAAPVVHNVVSSPVLPLSAAATHSFRSDLVSSPWVVAHEAPALLAEPVWPAAASIHPW
ncbi:uncharacterized protein LOC114340799 [Diabrotica virgifera virgifera]|uniref:Uncharacterized protein LOC114340799 n=1 Tax=Diabrotica virgifera virgifera TaxID=50390 RepID=A0A6P7GD63_DIAVI|nr:uncharacterized protein LOC114340799 [Diabrotica virgifera virgifera]